jgi:hypothetical protein
MRPLGAEQGAVAGEGDLAQARAAGLALPQGGGLGDQGLQIRVQQRFAAREPQAAGPQGHRRADHRQPLLQAQQPRRFHTIGQAVGAGQVAAGRE